MSGGSLDYAQYKLDDIAEMVAVRSRTPLHKAFVKHLRLVGEALHEFEWMASGDTGPGDEVTAIEKILGGKDAANKLQMKELKEELVTLMENARKLIDE